MSRHAVCIWVASACLTGSALSQAAAPRNPSVDELARTVVTIETETDGGSMFGSGVVVDPSGVVATAAHVINGARSAKVRVPSGDVMPVEGMVSYQPDLDLALVRVAGFNMPTARLGNSDSLTLGQHLLGITAPEGLEASVTDGLLSAKRQYESHQLLQVSVPVSHGSSGGPLFNDRGEVVALVVQGLRGNGAENLNFALPINYVRARLAIDASHAPTPLATFAFRDQPPTGMAAASTSESVNASLGLDFSALDGAEIAAERKGDRGGRVAETVVYSMASDPAGRPVLVRQAANHARVKIGLVRSQALYDDAIHSEVTVASPYQISESARRTALSTAVASSEYTLHLDGTGFRMSATDGGQHSGPARPGVLTPSLLVAAIAAMPDSLPQSAFVWVLSPRTGETSPVRVEFTGSDRVSIPVLTPGNRDCIAGGNTEDTTVAVMGVTITSGPDEGQFYVLASRPHLRVDKGSVKCMRIPSRRVAP